MNKEQGVCPVCNGTTRQPAQADRSPERYRWVAGYDAETHTLACNNCGGQYMFGEPSGLVKLRPDGVTPCHHEYTVSPGGRCLTKYTCKHCGDLYQIDSGD